MESRFAHNGTGLTRGDKLYWPREVRRIGDTFRPNLFVLSIGLNDRQFIVDGAGARTPWGAPDWTDKYRAEVVEFLKGAAASKAGVLIVGLPIVRDSEENADLQAKNRMFADAVATVAASNMQYVEPWRLNAAGTDSFASYGHDRNGRMVQIRTADGEHFTIAGEDLVAGYLFPKIVTMSHADEDLSPPTAGKSGDAAHVVRTAGVVIYATFLLLMLAIPQSLVNRLNDLNESAVQKILLQGASALQAGSRAAGLDMPYRRARSVFLALTGKEDE